MTTSHSDAVDSQTVAEAIPFLRFDADLNVEYARDASDRLQKRLHWVTAPFRFYLDPKQHRNVLHSAHVLWVFVPAGFLTDGASVPWPLNYLLPSWGKYGQAAVVHDYLIENRTAWYHHSGTTDMVPVDIGRELADEIFVTAMQVAGVGRIRRWLMGTAVKLWSKYRKSDVNHYWMSEKRALEEMWRYNEECKNRKV